MNQKPSSRIRHSTHWVRLLPSILLALCLLAGITAAGTISIDTTGLASATVGTTVQIPVKVTGATDLSGYQLKINTGDTAAAKIEFNATSVTAPGFYSPSNEAGNVIWAGAMSDLAINGETTLFLLDVTPKTAGPIQLNLEVVETFEKLAAETQQVANYAGTSATLSATGGSSEGTGGGSGSSGGSSSGGGSAGTVIVSATETVTTGITARETPSTNPVGTVPTNAGTTAYSTTVPTASATETASAGPTSTAKTPAPLSGLLTALGTAALIIRKAH